MVLPPLSQCCVTTTTIATRVGLRVVGRMLPPLSLRATRTRSHAQQQMLRPKASIRKLCTSLIATIVLRQIAHAVRNQSRPSCGVKF